MSHRDDIDEYGATAVAWALRTGRPVEEYAGEPLPPPLPPKPSRIPALMERLSRDPQFVKDMAAMEAALRRKP